MQKFYDDEGQIRASVLADRVVVGNDEEAETWFEEGWNLVDLKAVLAKAVPISDGSGGYLCEGNVRLGSIVQIRVTIEERPPDGDHVVIWEVREIDHGTW